MPVTCHQACQGQQRCSGVVTRSDQQMASNTRPKVFVAPIRQRQKQDWRPSFCKSLGFSSLVVGWLLNVASQCGHCSMWLKEWRPYVQAFSEIPSLGSRYSCSQALPCRFLLCSASYKFFSASYKFKSKFSLQVRLWVPGTHFLRFSPPSPFYFDLQVSFPFQVTNPLSSTS